MKSSLGFVLLTVLASAAFAQQPPPASTAPAGSMHNSSATEPPAGDAMKQTPPSTAQAADLSMIFDKLNVSHTGKMTKAEAQAHPTVAANFDAADTNHDGVVTKDEFLAAFRPAQ